MELNEENLKDLEQYINRDTRGIFEAKVSYEEVEDKGKALVVRATTQFAQAVCALWDNEGDGKKVADLNLYKFSEFIVKKLTQRIVQQLEDKIREYKEKE